MASSKRPRQPGESRAPKSKRAILKDPLPCSSGEDPATAPRGEYEVETTKAGGGVCRIGLCSCATHNRFTLSFDAFLQHLNEGRIALTRS